jgi:photosystem II stability/assembly factor-like uncharacterized protein
LTDIHFYDVNTGYTVGYNGTILKTTDGGSSWASQTSNTNTDLFSVDFVDDFVGYAVGGEYWDFRFLYNNENNRWRTELAGETSSRWIHNLELIKYG